MRIFNFLPRRRRRNEEALDRELRFHVDRRVADLSRSGMDEGEARRQAILELGGLTQVKEDVRETWGLLLESTLREFRHTLRMLRLKPAFSIVAVLTLALGIGATTAMFSVVHGVVIEPLPYPESEEVVTVGVSALFGETRGSFPLAPRMFATYAENGRSFEEFGLWSPGEAVVTWLDGPEYTSTLMTTRGFLTTLGVQPTLGRWFSPEDDRPGAPETVMLSNAYWQRRFGGDPGVLGEVVTVETRPREVIGVMPAGFSFQASAQRLPVDLILPFRFDPVQPPSDFCCQAIARLRPGATLDEANADVARMLESYQRDVNRPGIEALQLGPAVRPLQQDIVGDVGGVLWVLLGSIGILLLIACANVANLLLVRAEGRGRELALRTALGGGWGHIARTIMLDSLTLSLAGGLAGLGLAWAGLRILVANGPDDLPRLHELAIDLPVFAFALTTSILSGLLFGLIPIAKAIGSKRTRNLHGLVHGTGRAISPESRQRRSQNVLVVVQVALALVLVVGSGLMVRTFQNLRQVDPGFTDPETVQTLRLVLTEAEVPEAERVTRVQGEILDALAAIPGVTAAAFVNQVPMDAQRISAIVAAEGSEYGASGIPPTRTIKFMSPGLLETLGTPLLAGRDLTWEEVYEQRNVALVSESFAMEEWSTVDGALGKRILVGTSETWQEVVGVVADVRDDGADQEPPLIVYWPARLHPFVAGTALPRSIAFAIRSDRAGTEGLVQDIRQAVAAVMPSLPVFQARTLAEVFNRSMARTSFSLVLVGIAGAMALLLGIVGIYGVLAYAVAQSRREVGIRLALGATPLVVKQMFVYRGLALSGLGIALGLAAAAGLTRLMASLLFGVTPLDAITFAAAAGVLVAAALVASFVPASRAANIDPVRTLGEQ